jgi:5-methylcytosine-specific restriction endonuclease McrBC GTP-binding regulatory subunit McrB
MNENLHQLKASFIQKWPLRSIQNMTLEEYTNLDKTSFCYWVEAVTTDVGSIWGGSAYKFGIFKRRDLESTTLKENLLTDGEYGWAKKYGTTKEIAFQNIKNILLAIIENTQTNTIENIDEIDLGDAYKWKIAFLYGDFNIINIFKNESLLEAAQSLGYTGASKKFTDLYRFMLPLKKSEQDFFDFTQDLWQKTSLANPTRYWIYAPGLNANKWEEFYNEGIMGLGWDDLGDLDQYNSKNEIKKRLQEIEGVTTSKQNDTAANFEFHKEIKEGDFIFVKKGIHELLGYGIVTSDYYYDEEKIAFQKCRKVDWKLKGNWRLDFNLPLKTLTDITKYPTEDRNYSKYHERLLAIMKGETYNKNYKIEFNKWFKLKLPADSGTLNSYNKSIEILNTKLDFNIYENNDLVILNSLYEELKTVQKIEGNKYWDSKTPSYGKKGFYSASIKSYIDFHNELKTYAMSNSSKKVSLNTILYGPPGTGKTYNSINKAIAIINPDFDLTQDRKIVKEEFDHLVGLGQIVFTTFHQSMSYEDFVEGIKPKVEEDANENKQVVYEIEDGIFKRLANKAKLTNTSINLNSTQYSFDDAWDDLISEAEQNIENGTPETLKIQTPNLGLKIIEITERGNLKLKPIYSEDAKEYTVSYSRVKRLHEAFPDLSSVKNIDKEFRTVIGGSNSTAYWSILNIINPKIIANSSNINITKDSPSTPFVLIIDEINRGNISSIFGELITLIEDSKRLGQIEELEVLLPYSKTKFGVPSNLYIIGTMNTADRSVEALDTALRRRFSFEEMPPFYDLDGLKNEVFGYQLKDIIKTINKRIVRLLNNDHAIGHSYFLNKNEETLMESFYKNIIPLLQEYFFGDYGKMRLVLGDGFIQFDEWNEDDNFFASVTDSKTDYDIKDLYSIIEYKQDNKVGFSEALSKLMNR